MINNRHENLDNNDNSESCEIEGILVESQELKKVAARTILRASMILDKDQDEEVAQMLLQEASVMMSLVHRIENYFTNTDGTQE